MVAAGAAIWLARTNGASAPLALPAAVRAAAERASAEGLVLPGGERGADQPAPAFRSGPAADPPALARAADSLIAAYEGGARAADAAAQLVTALVAGNDLDAARDYAREGLERHPGDPRLLVLAAAVSYRGSDLAQAAGLLRAARARAPRDPVVALDLAIVLRQRGEAPAADRLLAEVARSREPALAARARAEQRAR